MLYILLLYKQHQSFVRHPSTRNGSEILISFTKACLYWRNLKSCYTSWTQNPCTLKSIIASKCRINQWNFNGIKRNFTCSLRTWVLSKWALASRKLRAHCRHRFEVPWEKGEQTVSTLNQPRFIWPGTWEFRKLDLKEYRNHGFKNSQGEEFYLILYSM